MPTKAPARNDNGERKSEVISESVTKIGNLTRDPELRFGAKGTAFTRVGLAVSRPKKPGDWKGEQLTEFYEVTAFGEVAEHAAECLEKGMRVVVVGRPELEHWQDDTGAERTTKRIAARELSPSLRWATLRVERVARTSGAATNGYEVTHDEEPF
jgi:single-strand DNA-binding protein